MLRHLLVVLLTVHFCVSHPTIAFKIDCFVTSCVNYAVRTVSFVLSVLQNATGSDKFNKFLKPDAIRPERVDYYNINSEN